jgi:hypothetical protein
MSNVKTGDIAWWMTDDGPWPVCTVGRQAHGGEIFENSFGRGMVRNTDNTLAWWCHFPREIELGRTNRGVLVTGKICPIQDRYLRRIADGNFTFPASELELALPKPIDAEERDRVQRIKDKKGTVIPK